MAHGGKQSEEEYKTSFRTGFMQALQKRLTTEQEESGEQALILIGTAMTKTQNYLASAVNGVSSTINEEIELRHQRAAEEGYRAGMKADLNTDRRVAGGTPVKRKEIAG